MKAYSLSHEYGRQKIIAYISDPPWGDVRTADMDLESIEGRIYPWSRCESKEDGEYPKFGFQALQHDMAFFVLIVKIVCGNDGPVW